MTARNPITPEYESLAHAAVRIGYSVFTMRELISEGKLRAYRINDKPGSTIRVKCADVDALFQPFIPTEVSTDRDGGAA